MDVTYPNSPLQNLLTLQETAQKLGVTPEVLLKWNDNHILSPKITLSGHIGYTEEQINQFLLIRQTLHHEHATEPISSLPLQPVQFQTPDSSYVPAQKHTISRFSISIAGISTVICITVLLTQQNKLLSFLNSVELSYRTPSNQIGQTSSAEITQPVAPLSPQNNGEKLHTQNTSALANAFVPTPTPAKKPSVKTTIAAQKAVKGLQDEEVASPSGTNTETQDLSTLASVSNTGSQRSSTLNGDDITGNAPKSSTLATILGAGMVGNNSVFQEVNTDLRSQVLFLLTAGGLVFLLFITKHRKLAPERQERPVYTEKIIELNQKMDGTVVLLFQGKEYKISKPELYSDSDRFFERLMQLMGPNTKEIEYDSLADTSKLITPLSRLVTRLGFVGIKRDLFFPGRQKTEFFLENI